MADLERRTTELLQRLIQFNTVNPPGNEQAAQAFLKEMLESARFREAFPECVAYGFFPQRKMDIFEGAPVIHGKDERIPVEDLGLAARFYAELVPKVVG